MILDKLSRLIAYNTSMKNYYKYIKNIGVIYGQNCDFSKKISWGSEPYLIKIGNHTRITNGVTFVTHDGGVWILRELKNKPDLDLIGAINIGDNCHIGMNVTIMPGVNIGNNVIVGCGAVVTHNIPDNEIWAGVPARKISDYEEYYNKHINDFVYTKNMSVQEKRLYLIDKYK